MDLARIRVWDLLLAAMIASGTRAPAFAQLAAVQLMEVKAVNTKRDSASGYANQSVYAQTRALRITLRNTTAQPLHGIKVRWGVVKDRLPSGNPIVKPYTAAFGAEETIDLKPFETRTIETAPVDAHGARWNYLPPSGEKIVGHGVQVVLGDKVVAEEITPPSYKKTFDKIYPPGVDPTAPGWMQRLQDKSKR
ncbi:MAG: hypothetical protein N2689_15935 [Verrucomicrobiae bacterium]|nr:hypothetical protein [Verrucomicrobiae bacterium]